MISKVDRTESEAVYAKYCANGSGTVGHNIMKSLFEASEGHEKKERSNRTKVDKAKLMLEKMGWKGQGLGKYEQGITTPLFAKKTNNKQGVIINKNLDPIDFNISDYYNCQPTKVIMLTNLVGKGEVDEELAEEVKEECSSFGSINSFNIFEFDFEDIPTEEAVRIFIEYNSLEESTFAFKKLFNRYFNNRIIIVRFYSEELYKSSQLDKFYFN